MPIVLALLSSFSSSIDLDLALADERVVELADLIALRQIGVEVILAVEARPGVDLRLERHAGAHRLADALAVRHRQHARHRRVDQADLGVGLGAELGRGAGEELGAVEVTWAWTSRPITTSHSPVAPWMRKGAMRRHHHHASGRAVKPARSSIAGRRSSTPCSSSGLPMSCRPSGRPCPSSPPGHRHGRQAGEAGRDREDVVQIHGDRIGRLLAEAEGGASARSG